MTKKQNAFTLIEALVAMGLLALSSIIVISVFVNTLRSAAKADVSREVKQNGDFAISTLTRHLRNASEITNCSSNRVDYEDSRGATGFFSCVSAASGSYIASGSATVPLGARITNSSVSVVSCNIFQCYGLPIDQVLINFAVQYGTGNGTDVSESSSANFASQVKVRSI